MASYKVRGNIRKSSFCQKTHWMRCLWIGINILLLCLIVCQIWSLNQRFNYIVLHCPQAHSQNIDLKHQCYQEPRPKTVIKTQNKWKKSFLFNLVLTLALVVVLIVSFGFRFFSSLVWFWFGFWFWFLLCNTFGIYLQCFWDQTPCLLIF